MVFSSLPFIYFFFPLVFLLYFAWKNRTWRNAVLLAASLFFYAWGEPKLIVLMLLATLAAWLGGLVMQRREETGDRAGKRLVLILTTALLVGNFFIFKYLDLAVGSLNALGLSLPLPGLRLPIGISFYTFQILSYVIDLYRGRVEVQRSYFRLLLYVSFFPQLIAGPIVRYQTVEQELRDRAETLDDVAAGFRRFIVGLAKKVILANGAAAVAETIYAGDPAVYGTACYWLAALAYALQIYFDFSGYSDMAIGLGRMFGFHFLENFDHPYVSLSITEFWRRWHISLGTWFRDYVYIPLGGSRVSRPKWVRNILVVWALTGLWHGAQWNFLLWGLYYAALLLVEKLWLGKRLDRLPKGIRWLYTMFFVLVGWVLFDLTDFAQMAAALRQMFVFRPTVWGDVVAAEGSILYGLVFLPLGLVCMLPWRDWLHSRRSRKGKVPLLREDGLPALALADLACLVLALVCVAVIVSSTYDPFIYFRF